MKLKKTFLKMLTFSMWAFGGTVFAEMPAFFHCQYQLKGDSSQHWAVVDSKQNQYIQKNSHFFQGAFSTEKGAIEREDLGGIPSSSYTYAALIHKQHFLLEKFDFEVLKRICFDEIQKNRGAQNDEDIDLRELRVSSNSFTNVFDSVSSKPGYPLSYKTADGKILRVLAKDKYRPSAGGRLLGADERLLMGTLGGQRLPTLLGVLLTDAKAIEQTGGAGDSSCQKKRQQGLLSQLALIRDFLNPDNQERASLLACSQRLDSFATEVQTGSEANTDTATYVEECKKDIVKFLGIKSEGASNEILIQLLVKYGLEISADADNLLLQADNNRNKLLAFLNNIESLKNQIERSVSPEKRETAEMAATMPIEPEIKEGVSSSSSSSGGGPRKVAEAHAYTIAELLERPKNSEQIREQKLSQELLLLANFWNGQSEGARAEIEEAFRQFHQSGDASFNNVAQKLGSSNSQYTLYLICRFILSNPTIQAKLIDFIFQSDKVSKSDDFFDAADFSDPLESGAPRTEIFDQGSRKNNPINLNLLSQIGRAELMERDFNVPMIIDRSPQPTLENHQREMIYFNDMSYHAAKIFQWLHRYNTPIEDIKNFISAIFDPNKRKDFLVQKSGFEEFAKTYLQEGSNYYYFYLNLLEFVDQFFHANWSFTPFYGETGVKSVDDNSASQSPTRRPDLSGFIAYNQGRKLITTVLHGSTGGLKLYNDEGDWVSNKEGWWWDFFGLSAQDEYRGYFDFKGRAHRGIMARSKTFVPEMREGIHKALSECGLLENGQDSDSKEKIKFDEFKLWKLFVTGHSLGGASSYFAAEALSLYLMKNFGLVFNEHLKNRLLVYSLSAPKISFGTELAEYFNSKFGTNNLLMHYTEGDIVTAVPYIGYHIGRMAIQTAQETYDNEKKIYETFNHEYNNSSFINWIKTYVARAHFGSRLFYPQGHKKKSGGAMFSSALVGDNLWDYISRADDMLPPPLKENKEISRQFNKIDPPTVKILNPNYSFINPYKENYSVAPSSSSSPSPSSPASLDGQGPY